MDKNGAYHLAQSAISDLKAAIFCILEMHPDGIKNAQLGRTLGINAGHVGHEGHIPRTLLGMMEDEGVVEQNPTTKLWKLRSQQDDHTETA